jgi:hypothetical protein
MKSLIRRLRALTGFFLVALAPAIHGQTAKSSPGLPFLYDSSEEITVSGSVTGVLTKASKGMMNGSHLLILTPSGAIDVSLGAYGLVGRDAVTANLGDQAEVTGVMKTLNTKPVLMARTVTVRDHVYAIRNEHGIAMSPQARERVRSASAPDGGAR